MSNPILTRPRNRVNSRTVTPASATLGANQELEVTVRYTIGSVNGRVTLTANNFGGSATDRGFFNIAASLVGPPTIALRNQNGDNIDRSACLTSGAGEAAAFECGDLVVTHAMPSFSTMNRARNLTLLYNSAQAMPKPLVAMAVTEPSTISAPLSVYAELKVNNVVRASSTYPVWNTAPFTRQLVLTYDASADSSGVYPFTLEVQNRYSTATYSDTVSGNLIVVNRSQSRHGIGWSVVGVEELRLGQPGGAILWVGGDGSAKVYSQINSTTWVAAPGGYRDTLTLSASVYTRTLRHGVQVKYDAQGRHTQTISRTLQTTTFTYDGSGRLSTIAVPPGGSANTYTLTYAGSGFLDKITDPGARVLDANVNATTRELSSLTDPDNVSTSFSYNAGRMTGRTSRRGFRTDYQYFNSLRLSRVSVPIATGDSAVTIFAAWDEKGLPGLGHGDTAQAFTVIHGPRISVPDDASFWVDRWGAPTKIVNAIGAVTTLVRGDAAVPLLVTRVTYPNPAGGTPGRIATMTYDARGNLTQVRDSTSHLGTAGLATKVTRYVYASPNTNDSPSQVLDSVGSTARATAYTYTSLGLTNDVVDSRGHRTVFGYTTGAIAGLVNSVTEKSVQTWIDSTGFLSDTSFAKLDLVQQFGFDAKGNLKTATSPGKVVTSYVTDAFGRVTDVYDPLGFRQSWGYDPMNRTTATTRFTAKTAHPGGVLPLANCRRSFLFCGDSTRNVNSSFGVSVGVSYNYGAADLNSITDARGITRSFVYDSRGLMIEERDGFPTPRTRRTRYDAAGNVVSRIQGVDSIVTDTVTYNYDDVNRLQAVTLHPEFYANNETVPGDTVRYTYDQVGDPVTVTNRKGSIVRSYYGDGSVKSKKSNATFPDSLFFTYDQSGARTLMSHTANGVTDVVTYNYSNLTGDLQSYTVNWGPPANLTRTVAFLWDTLGRRRQITYPNNTVVKYRYDGAGIVRRVIASNPTNTSGVGDRLDFTFRADSIDAAGRALRQRITCAGFLSPDVALGYACGASPSINWSNRYNRFGKLIYQNAGVPDSFDFDRSDNMVFHKVGSQTPHWYTINTNGDQVIADSIAGSPRSAVTFFRYDSVGGRTYDYTTSNFLRVYYYDGMGRTSGIRDTFHNGTNRANCIGYDADGNIQSPCDDVGNWLQYDGPNVSGATSVRYWSFVHGPALDDPLVGLYRDRSNPTVYKEWYWITDGQGRQFATSAPDGTLGSIPATEYSENGGSYAGGTQNANTFKADRFGSPIVPGISFFRNRAYDQQTGRWTQEDPIGVAGGLNLYQFNGNNPVTFTDPFGLKECEERGNCTQADGGEMESRGVEMRRSDVIEPTEASPLFFMGGIEKAEGKALGGVLTGFTRHGLNQAISRDGVGVATDAILSAVKNPLKVVEQAGGAVKYIGENATVILNDAGKVVTTWARNSLGWRIKP